MSEDNDENVPEENSKNISDFGVIVWLTGIVVGIASLILQIGLITGISGSWWIIPWDAEPEPFF